jgi:asparagine N-glycosylation enzyme membrane subunit Stt3
MIRYLISMLIGFVVFFGVGFSLHEFTEMRSPKADYTAYAIGVLAFIGFLNKLRSARSPKTPLLDIGRIIIVVFGLPFVGHFATGGYHHVNSFAEIVFASLHFFIAIIALIIGVIIIFLGCIEKDIEKDEEQFGREGDSPSE